MSLPKGFEYAEIPFPIKIDNHGKEVFPHIFKEDRELINPIYRYAREQVMVFVPDVMTLRIPKACPRDDTVPLEHAWVGNIMWRNIPRKPTEDDPIGNPDGNIGFYRALLGYAAQPIRPDFGWIITEPKQ